MTSSIKYLEEKIKFANKELYAELFEDIQQAKIMHEDEIVDAYNAGIWDIGSRSADADDYYNETYGEDTSKTD